MILCIEQGKGRRDRHAMLAPSLLELLRRGWRESQRQGKMLPHSWLFPGQNLVDPLPTRQLNRFVKAAAEGAGTDNMAIAAIDVVFDAIRAIDYLIILSKSFGAQVLSK